MTNTELLEREIAYSGIKKGKIAETLGISYTSLRRKMDNTVDFKADEVLKLCKVLGINSAKKRDAIFFNENVGE